MTRTNGLITLFISLAIMLVGCGKPAPGYKIHRIDDALLVFLAMNDSSKIGDVAIDDRVLYVDIDTGERIEKRATSLQEKLLPLVGAHETLKISGTDRINGYGVIHLTIASPNPRNLSVSFHWSGLQIKIHPKKPGPFKNSGTFRVGNRITAYASLQDDRDLPQKPAEDENGRHLLTVKTTDGKIRNLSFLIKDLAPHETVEVEDKKELGDDMYIVYWKVVPKENRVINNLMVTDR